MKTKKLLSLLLLGLLCSIGNVWADETFTFAWAADGTKGYSYSQAGPTGGTLITNNAIYFLSNDGPKVDASKLNPYRVGFVFKPTANVTLKIKGSAGSSARTIQNIKVDSCLDSRFYALCKDAVGSSKTVMNYALDNASDADKAFYATVGILKVKNGVYSVAGDAKSASGQTGQSGLYENRISANNINVPANGNNEETLAIGSPAENFVFKAGECYRVYTETSSSTGTQVISFTFSPVYQLTWDLDGGSATSAPYTVAGYYPAGTALTAPTVTKENHEFKAWSPAVAATMPAANTTYTAIWTATATFTVSFNAGDHGTCGTSSLTEASAGAGVTLPSVTASTGYAFNGWYSASIEGTKVGDPSDTFYPDKDSTLFAQYSANTYTITLDDNGGTADGEATATYSSNKLTSITAPTWADHTLVGYYAEAECTTLIADAEGNLQANKTGYTGAGGIWTATSDKTLYAKWLTRYTITYNKGANGTGTIDDGDKIEDVAFTLSSERFTRAGYLQTGWATSDGGAQAYALGGSYTTNADIELFPVWKKTQSVSLFNYEDEKSIAELESAGWTFNSAVFDADPADSETYVNLVSAMTTAGLTAPGTNSMQTNAIAFAKNTSAFAKYDLGEAQTITAISGTFCIGSGNDRSFKIQYLNSSGTELASFTINHSKVNWGANNVNEVRTVENVRFIKINAVAEKSWMVMNNLSIFTPYVDYVSASTLADRNYATMVTPVGKKLDFSAVSDDITAYIAKGLNGAADAVRIEAVDVVPAGTPILIKTESQGVTINVPVTTADASDVSANKLVAGDGTTTYADGTYYFLKEDQFHLATSGTLQVGKAYLQLSGALAPALRIVEGENNATDIQAINATDKAVKFIENGQLLIKRDGITYDALGRVIR